MRARGSRSVSAGGDIGVAVTGDDNQIVLAPAVRSAYWEQVRRIAPFELVDRDRELDDLAAFCTAESGPSYVWWRAAAWAGKTALMSWFALHPPHGVRIVPFFVTARLGAQNDVVAYVDVVLEQLAELVGEGIPGYLTEATREAHLLRMYREAAEVCAQRGERLVLIVDGLDEDRGVTTGSEAHSIASLLPARPEHGMRVVVASRLNPPLPGDVAQGHPLWCAEAVRPLSLSPRAEVIRAEAERELKCLIETGGLEYDLLALVTAAGGGLAAADLSALTGSSAFRVQDVLRTRAGRTFGIRASVYLLGHEELQSQAEEMLGAAELDRYRARLHAWADDWRERGWPDATPEYLLRGYFSMLRATDDLPRMLRCALDTVRHERMLDVTGGDAAALDEIRTTQEVTVDVAERGRGGDLLAALRLAMHRDELAGRSARISEVVPEAWAVLGKVNRAEALAYSLTDPESRAAVLMAIAGRLADAGDPERARTLLTDARTAVRRVRRTQDRDRMTRRLCLALVAIDECGRAADLLGSVPPAHTQDVLVRLVAKHLAGDRFASARAAADRIIDPARRALAFAALAAARFGAGAAEDAEAVLRAGGPEARALALVSLSRTREPAESGRLLDEAVETAGELKSPWGVVEALVEAGELQRAAILATRVRNTGGGTAASVRDRDRAWATLARADAEHGELRRAESWLTRMADPTLREAVSADLAAELVRRGKLEQADRLVEEVDGDRQLEWAQARVAGALAEAGDFARAAERGGGLFHEEARSHLLVALADTGACLGRMEEAEALIRELADFPFSSEAMARVALTLALRGRAAESEQILCDLEEEARSAVLVPGDLFKLADALKALADAGHTAEAAAVVASEPPMLAHLEALVWPDDELGMDLYLMAGCEVLAGAGAFQRLEAMLEGAPDHLLILFPLVEALAGGGQIERARALLAGGPSESGRKCILAAVARGLVLKGDDAAALEAVSGIANVDEQISALARLALTAQSVGRCGDAELLLGAAADLADQVCGPEVWSPTTPLVEALVALGQVDAARLRLATAVSHADITQDELPSCARLLAFVGRHDEAEALVDGIEDAAVRVRARAEVGEVLAEAGAYDRAERLARGLLPLERETGRVLGKIACHADEPRARRLLFAALHHISWTQVLPALLRLEPRAVPLVVEALRGPVAVESTSNATWRSPLGPERPTAARTSAQSAN
ncbi:hypothetical protein [Streptomyces sp. NPDC056464]|uniref:hypothetical protein n=1 Tax=Streptomyces sp. NPDC056464 TaxID=3345828 RepID=UPI00367DE7D4